MHTHADTRATSLFIAHTHTPKEIILPVFLDFPLRLSVLYVLFFISVSLTDSVLGSAETAEFGHVANYPLALPMLPRQPV